MKNHSDPGQSIGFSVPEWVPRAAPSRKSMSGTYCDLVTVDVERDANDLHSAFQLDRSGMQWTYMAYGPFDDLASFQEWLGHTCLDEDPLFFTVRDSATSKAVGLTSFLRVNPQHGVLEVGHLNFSPLMQRTRIATESMALMMKRAFDELGYRRYEWKCDDLNRPSRRAAERLGFRYEGTFRQAVVYKNRNRDTAWYSVIDAEWPILKRAFELWLDPSNFDPAGKQRRRLDDIRKKLS